MKLLVMVLLSLVAVLAFISAARHPARQGGMRRGGCAGCPHADACRTRKEE